MKEKNPLDEILKEIGLLLDFAQANAGKPIKVEDEKRIMERLDQLEAMMEEYRSQLTDSLREEGITEKVLEEGKYKIPKGLNDKQIATWKKATQMWWDAEGMKYALQEALRQLKKEEEMPSKWETSEDKRRAAKVRLEKFKRIGGKKHWKPL